VRFGFEELDLARIVAVVRPANEASKAVLRKAGLDFVEHGYHYGATVEFWTVYASDDVPRPAEQRHVT
jgi:RimJ/RimL family protein N-acetyltransferase